MCKSKWWTPKDGTQPEEIKLLTTSNIKVLREILIDTNEGLCDLCELPINKPTLDHHHKKDGGNGDIRAAICNSCNRRLARVENNWRARMAPAELAQWMIKAGQYIDRHYTNPSNINHPTERAKTKKKIRKSK